MKDDDEEEEVDIDEDDEQEVEKEEKKAKEKEKEKRIIDEDETQDSLMRDADETQDLPPHSPPPSHSPSPPSPSPPSPSPPSPPHSPPRASSSSLSINKQPLLHITSNQPLPSTSSSITSSIATASSADVPSWNEKPSSSLQRITFFIRNSFIVY